MMSFLSNRHTRGIRMLLLAAFCAAGGVAQAQTNEAPKASPRRPSVILIVADELGYGDLGCYGQKMIPTPRIDALATNGMRFTDFYAANAYDLSARAALLTGQAAPDAKLPAGRTLAEQLQQAGYTTGFIGYWGLGEFNSADAPQRRGFDVVIAYGDRRHAHDLYTGYVFRRDPHTGFEDAMALAGNQPGKQSTYLPDLLTQAATRFCKQYLPEKLNDYRPFFLQLSYPVPAAVAARSGPVPETAVLADKAWPALQQEKAKAISRLDAHVGQLLDELEMRGMAQNTIILLTSSLGPDGRAPLEAKFFQSTGPFTTGNQPLAEGRLRVPLIVQWPFWIRTGRVSEQLLSGADIMPTLVEAAGLAVPAPLAGISFLPLLQGRPQTNQHAHLNWTMVDEAGNTHEAVRQGQWKAVRQSAEQPWQLYDLAADPGEQIDVADQQPEVGGELEATLERPAENGGASPGPASGG